LRVFLYSLAGIPILVLDGMLLYTLPARLAGRFSLKQALILSAGSGCYLILHFLLRKPERLYLWAHELTHLITAKLFLREVHGFHITSRAGGKVVIDRTNVAIDLAPYAVPLYSLAAMVPFLLFHEKSPYSRDIYLAGAAFLFTMHMVFTLEGFFRAQPDLTRSGRLFSAGVVALFLILLVPFLSAPGTHSGFSSLAQFYKDWLFKSLQSGPNLFRQIPGI